MKKNRSTTRDIIEIYDSDASTPTMSFNEKSQFGYGYQHSCYFHNYTIFNISIKKNIIENYNDD